jgi:hypothetical protein
VSNTDAAIIQIILILDATGIAPLEAHISVGIDRQSGPCVCKIKPTELRRRYNMRFQNANVNLDYCGTVILLRHLVQDNICTQKEAKKIALRIAAQTGVDIIFPI